jgi:hypothetical protein
MFGYLRICDAWGRWKCPIVNLGRSVPVKQA